MAAEKALQRSIERGQPFAAGAEDNDRTGILCFVGRMLDLRGLNDDAVEFYRAAVAEPAGRFSATHAWVCAALRDRGLAPEAKP